VLSFVGKKEDVKIPYFFNRKGKKFGGGLANEDRLKRKGKKNEIELTTRERQGKPKPTKEEIRARKEQ